MNQQQVNMDKSIKDAAELMKNRKQCVVLTGAGISAESGIPTFRSRGGLWEKYDPAVYASIDVFKVDPSKYWTIRGDFIRNYDDYQPNNAHRALAELETVGIVKTVITQNIDGLHKKAGSKKCYRDSRQSQGNLLSQLRPALYGTGGSGRHAALLRKLRRGS